jgi:hypothetical protein
MGEVGSPNKEESLPCTKEGLKKVAVFQRAEKAVLQERL